MEQTGNHTNREKSIDNPNFKLKIGTINTNNPEVIYIEGKTFIMPKDDKADYEYDIKAFKHHLKRSVQKMLSENEKVFDKMKYMLNFDIATDGMMSNKKSYLSIQLLLKQKQMMKLKELHTYTIPIISKIMNDLSEKVRESNYTLTKNKS